MNFEYKNKDLSTRKQEANSIMKNNPDRIPVICERDPNCKIDKLINQRFLPARDMTASQFSFTVRRRLDLSKDAAIFFIVDGKKTLTGGELMGNIYDLYRDLDDNNLYIHYSSESIYG